MVKFPDTLRGCMEWFACKPYSTVLITILNIDDSELRDFSCAKSVLEDAPGEWLDLPVNKILWGGTVAWFLI